MVEAKACSHSESSEDGTAVSSNRSTAYDTHQHSRCGAHELDVGHARSAQHDVAQVLVINALKRTGLEQGSTRHFTDTRTEFLNITCICIHHYLGRHAAATVANQLDMIKSSSSTAPSVN